jgi:LmbE family N-acetylglucosaminyl deacetylase
MKILAIFSHPDDETLFCGGTIARHVGNGDEIIWICGGLGERSGNSAKRYSKLFYVAHLILGSFLFLTIMQKMAVWWRSVFTKKNFKLAENRKTEALNVAKILGISKVVFLEIEDMKFGKFFEKMTREIKKYIVTHEPGIIYTFHPNGLTGHPDHVALSRAVIAATESVKNCTYPKIYAAAISKENAKKFKLPLLGVKKGKINLAVSLNENEMTKKKEAIKAYKSQSYIWKIFLEKNSEILKTEYFMRMDLYSRE